MDDAPSGRATAGDPPGRPAAVEVVEVAEDELSDDALAAVVGGVSLEAALARAAAFSAAAATPAAGPAGPFSRTA